MNQTGWRGINWSKVARIEGRPGTEVTVHMEDGSTKVLSHYPGEGTYQRAKAELARAQND